MNNISHNLVENELNVLLAIFFAKTINQTIGLNLTFISSFAETFSRIGGLRQINKNLIETGSSFKINQDGLIEIISLGATLIKTLDDISKITTNNRPIELLENKCADIAESFLSTETKDYMAKFAEKFGLSKKSIMNGAKQFMYISSMLLADKYLSQKTGSISDAEILGLSALSTIFAVTGDFIAKEATEHYRQKTARENPPQIQIILPQGPQIQIILPQGPQIDSTRLPDGPRGETISPTYLDEPPPNEPTVQPDFENTVIPKGSRQITILRRRGISDSSKNLSR